MSLPKTTVQWVLAHRPAREVVIEGPDSTFQLKKDVPLAPLQDNQLLIQALYFSNAPAQRTWIWKNFPAERHYTNLVQEGEVMHAGYVICKVLSSTSASFKPDQLVMASPGWTLHAVVDASTCCLINSVPGFSIVHLLGAFGVTGATAWYGLIDIGRASKDDVVCVSGAAGATGSMVVQIAKHVLGCKRVIGIAGGEKKCRWVESIGADICVNYKASDFHQQLADATNDYVNVYFDNVGGTILDRLITRMARFGRIVACGDISAYNTSGKAEDATSGVKNWFQIIVNRLEVKGFLYLDLGARWDEYIAQLMQAAKQGKIGLTDYSNTVVETQWEDLPKTWNLLFTGGNQGALITKVVA